MQRLKKNIVLIAIDEAHVSLPSQWGNEEMREDMFLAPAYLRAQVSTTTKAPVLAMTASASSKVAAGKSKTKSEVDQIKDMCGIQFSETTVITISPVLHNHIFVNVKKPPSVYQFYGRDSTSSSDQRLGSVHLLWRIYLKQFVGDIKEGKTPKKAIIYVKRYIDLADLDEFLTLELGMLNTYNNII